MINIQRQESIDDLNLIKGYVNNTVLTISDDERNSLNESIDCYIRYARYGRYHVTALGVFSTGKSTLINAMIGEKILPAADLPTTAITTEIYASEESSFFIPMENVSDAVLKNFKDGLTRHFAGVQFVDKLVRDGQSYCGIGGIVASENNDLIYGIVTELTSQQKRKDEPFKDAKKLLEDDKNLCLWLGISSMPEWLQDIVLTDAPGTGSIEEGHEIIINKIIPASQLVLFLTESTKAGGKIDKNFLDRVCNVHHRKVFYLLNKIDQQNLDEQAEAMDYAKRSVPNVAKDGVALEFLQVAGLPAHIAKELKAGRLSCDEILNPNNVKLNFNKLLMRKEWHQANDVQKQKLMIDFLMDVSKYAALQSRIEDYLKNENKEVAIAQQSNKCIAATACKLDRACENALRVLQSDVSIDELKRKADDAYNNRMMHGKEAEGIIKDYRLSATNEEKGILGTITGLGEKVPHKIVEELERVLNNKDWYKKLQEKKELENWLKKEIKKNADNILENVCQELSKLYGNLCQQLSPILKKIEGETLGSSLAQPDCKLDISTKDKLDAVKVGGGAMAGGLAALGVASTLTAFGIGGTGIAGTLGAWGFGTLSTWAASAGMGTTLMCASALIPIVGVAAIAGGVVTYMLVNNKDRKIHKILEKAEKDLKEVVCVGEESLVSKMKSLIKKEIETSSENMEEQINKRLGQIKAEEDNLIAEYEKSKGLRNQKMAELQALQKAIHAIYKKMEMSIEQVGI